MDKWMILFVVGVLLAAMSPSAIAQSRNTPEWVLDAVLYQVYVRAFSKEGTFQAVTDRIPELADLGVNTLYLMPFHPIGQVGRTGSLGSPYSIKDFKSIDPALGDEEALRELIDTAHAHGMKVIMDLVINHTALDHPFVREHPEWYRWEADGTLMHPDPLWKDVAQLNYNDQDLRSYMIDMASYWVQEFDFDGFRADVSYKIPVDFWLRFRDELRAIKPDLMLLSESDTPAMLLAFDIVYNWPLGERVRQVATRQKLPFTLLEGLNWPRMMNYLENHDHPRIASLTGGRSTKPYATFLLTMSGVPLIQNGQEIGAVQRLSLFDPAYIDWRLVDHDLRAHYQKLIAIRHDLPELRRGTLRVLNADQPGFVISYIKQFQDSRTLVVINFSHNEQSVTLPHDVLSPSRQYIDLMSESAVSIVDQDGSSLLTLSPYQSLIVPLEY